LCENLIDHHLISARVSTPRCSGKAAAKAGKTLDAPTKVIVRPLGITNPSIIGTRIIGMEVVVKIADGTKRFPKAVSWIIMVVARCQGECL
jgi:hypothetical protein